MKLSLKDIKKKLKEPPKVIKPQAEQFENFSVPGPIDLEPFKVREELWVLPEYITSELESKVLKQGVYNQSNSRWTKLRTRNAQMWGGNVSPQGLQDKEPLPRWLDIFAQRLFDEKVFPLKPNHVLVNEYHPGDGIMAHTDGPAYFPLVAILSMGSISVMTFWEDNPRKPAFSVILPAQSLLIMTGDLYYNYLHSIEQKPVDYIMTDDCGVFYTHTEDNQLSPVLNYSGPSEPKDSYIEPCPRCGNELRVVESIYRSVRVSLTIRYVPI